MVGVTDGPCATWRAWRDLGVFPDPWSSVSEEGMILKTGDCDKWLAERERVRESGGEAVDLAG